MTSRMTIASATMALLLAFAAVPAARAGQYTVPPEQRSTISWERSGEHSANRIRTIFYNWGMVGD